MISAFLTTWLLLGAIAGGDVGNWLANISDADALIRTRAVMELESRRRRFEVELSRQVKDVLAKRDDYYHGRTHTVLQAVTGLRAQMAIPDLVRSVDFTLDPDTFPAGARYLTIRFYPAAEALVSIGNKRVINEILQAASLPQDDKVMRIYAWILTEVLKPGGFVRSEKKLLRRDAAAHVVVEQAMANAQPLERERLSRLLKMVDEEIPLQRPTRKPKRNRPILKRPQASLRSIPTFAIGGAS